MESPGDLLTICVWEEDRQKKSFISITVNLYKWILLQMHTFESGPHFYHIITTNFTMFRWDCVWQASANISLITMWKENYAVFQPKRNKNLKKQHESLQHVFIPHTLIPPDKIWWSRIPLEIMKWISRAFIRGAAKKPVVTLEVTHRSKAQVG